jgi:hypothetical protein
MIVILTKDNLRTPDIDIKDVNMHSFLDSRNNFEFAELVVYLDGDLGRVLK